MSQRTMEGNREHEFVQRTEWGGGTMTPREFAAELDEETPEP